MLEAIFLVRIMATNKFWLMNCVRTVFVVWKWSFRVDNKFIVKICVVDTQMMCPPPVCHPNPSWYDDFSATYQYANLQESRILGFLWPCSGLLSLAFLLCSSLTSLYSCFCFTWVKFIVASPLLYSWFKKRNKKENFG